MPYQETNRGLNEGLDKRPVQIPDHDPVLLSSGSATGFRPGEGTLRGNLKPNGQDVGFSGYGGIEDVARYVNAEYGSGWAESNSAFIPGIGSFGQSALEKGANNCTLASITRLMKYYSDIGYTRIPSDVEAIYEKVREIGVRHGYDPKKTGLFRDLFVYTPWEIDNMVRDAWLAFGYGNGSGKNFYLGKLRIIMSSIDRLDPLLMNIASGDYNGHTVSVTGYRVFSREGAKDRAFVRIFDGWSEAVRYIDYTKLGITPSSVTSFFPPFGK